MNPIRLTAPSRIHFGLFSISAHSCATDVIPRKFGGAGLMIRRPEILIESRHHDQLKIAGPDEKLIRQHITNWFSVYQSEIPKRISNSAEIPIFFEIKQSPVRHCGFGSGTQLALSIAMILTKWLKLDCPDIGSLAASMKRGRRSAIGTYGFFQGGFLVDRGIADGDLVSPLDLRFDFPDSWRIVTFTNRKVKGVHGSLEGKAFDQLTSPAEKRDRLIRICREHIVPAVVSEDFEMFGDPLYEFNRLSGEYFKDFQLGSYCNESSRSIVMDLRSIGVRAVGQSSWGPTIFAVVASQERASEVVNQLKKDYSSRYISEDLDITITKCDNSGVQLNTVED